MKRIYFTLAFLFLVIAGMAYLYFSNLSTGTRSADQSLKIAAQNAAVVYRVQNDKSVMDILDGQDLLSKIIGQEKTELVAAIRQTLLSDPTVASLLDHKTFYISVLPGKDHNLDFMICTQLNTTEERNTLAALAEKRKVGDTNSKLFSKIAGPNNTFFYLGFDGNVLILSNESTTFSSLNKKINKDDNDFSDFILSNDRLTKNSLANLYINYSKLPELIKVVIPKSNDEEFDGLKLPGAYSHLSYNFSKTNIFFNGETQLSDKSSYLALFLNTPPQKLDMVSILPQNTASFILYNTGNFMDWSKRLRPWFDSQPANTKIKQQVTQQAVKYRVVLDNTFPKLSNNQFITFQLQQGQKLGAIRLTNGDKLGQLLLDLTDDVDGTIRQFKEEGLLYYYFGSPFKKFQKPYYIIKDNYIIFSNYAANLQEFQNNYQANRLLVNEVNYSKTMDLLPNTTSVLYYLNLGRATALMNKLVYPSFAKHIKDKDGINSFDAFIFQISANKESFQTNLLVPSKQTLAKDTLQYTNK